MPRLPTPGSDNGSWGSILNEYLSQSLASNGTLKDDIVGSAQLQDEAVTTGKLAAGVVTAAKVAADVATQAELDAVAAGGITLVDGGSAATPRITNIKLRRGTAAQWAAANPVLDSGELGLETDTGVVKAGDSSTAWSALSPILNSIYNRGISLGLASGSDDAPTINARLASAAAAGVNRVFGIPGQAYKYASTLIVPSGVTLDMTGCTVTALPAATCKMITNASAVAPVRSVTDAAVTASSTTLTSATAAFTAADTGRTIVVAGALPTSNFGGANSGTGPLTAIMTYVNATTVTLSVASPTTMTGASASIWNRDTRITVIGGLWDRGAVGATIPVDRHSFFFRHVDGLVVRDLEYVATVNNKFAINVGAATEFRVEGIRLRNGSSDGVHISGPAARGVVTRIQGYSSDDFIALTAREYSPYEDVAGDITDIQISDVQMTSGLACVKLLAGDSAAVRRVTMRNLINRGGAGDIAVMFTYDGTSAAVIDDCVVDGLHTVYKNGVSAQATSIPRLTIRGVSMSYSSGQSRHVYVYPSSTVGNLSVERCTHDGASTSNASIISAGTITQCQMSNVHLTQGVGSSAYLYRHDAATASCASLTITNSSLQGGGGFIGTGLGGTLTLAQLSNCYSNQASWFCDIGTTTTVVANGCRNNNPQSGGYNIRATAVLVHRGAGNHLGSFEVLAGGGSFRVNDSSYQGSLANVTAPAVGDQLHNNAAATGVRPGVGPVVYDGTAWKRVDLGGVVKTGTATLVAGTVTVADTAITASGKIRVYPATLGGTPGALFISAKSAGVSFTITSTNAADTSTVQYDIVQY